MFSDVLHKGDLNDGFNGAINGMSIVNCLENESPSAGEFLTLSIVCLLLNNVQQMQFPQVKHLGNKLCEQILAFATSFVTGIGKCAVGDLHSAVGDLLVDRSGVDTTVGDRLSDRGAKAGVFGLWVWAWLVVGNASTPGD